MSYSRQGSDAHHAGIFSDGDPNLRALFTPVMGRNLAAPDDKGQSIPTPSATKFKIFTRLNFTFLETLYSGVKARLKIHAPASLRIFTPSILGHYAGDFSATMLLVGYAPRRVCSS